MEQMKKEDMNAICICGHPKSKHRPRNWSCRKCKCKRFELPDELEQKLRQATEAHPEDCTCAECAWRRLEIAEKKIEHLTKRLNMVDKVVEMLEMLAGNDIPEWITIDGDCIKPEDVKCTLRDDCKGCPYNMEDDAIEIDASAGLPENIEVIEEERPVEEEKKNTTG